MVQVRYVALALLLLSAATGFAFAEEAPRGKYVYDDANRLSIEARAMVSALLWRMDATSGYEMVVAFPNQTLSDAEAISWFNEKGVGKKDVDNGAALFVFPDDTYFLLIGRGNDVVTVTAGSTYGSPVLKTMSSDPVLSLLKFIDVFAKDLSEKPVVNEVHVSFAQLISENIHLIALWGIVAALGVFLVQQADGFQRRDLVISSIIVFALLILFAVGASASEERSLQATYQDYGIITATNTTGPIFHPHVHTVCTPTGKSVSCRTYTNPSYHYYNKAALLTYNLKTVQYTFFSEAEFIHNKDAWSHGVGEVDSLTIREKTGEALSASRFNDVSGGRTAGDGFRGS